MNSDKTDQPAAGFAMVGSWRLEDFAFPAPALPRVVVLDSSIVSLLIDGIDQTPVPWHAAWTCDACPQIANPQTKHKQIELNELSVGERPRLDV